MPLHEFAEGDHVRWQVPVWDATAKVMGTGWQRAVVVPRRRFQDALFTRVQIEDPTVADGYRAHLIHTYLLEHEP